MIVDIKEISGNIRFSTPINEGCKRKFMLMKEDYITLKFSVTKPILFKLGDGIDNELGMFELVDPYKPIYNESNGGYDYELRLDAYYWKWKNKTFKFTPETGGKEASWNLTASLDVQLSVVIRNLNALGYKYRESAFDFSIDSTVENAAKSMSYSDVNLIDALSQMAESWECEWWITDNIINFGRCEYNEKYPVDLELGKNVDSMIRSDSQSGFATRVYAFGSTRNIPTNYRPVDESVVVNGIVQKRLMLPVGIPYIDAYPDMTTEEAVEDIVVFEDVYPRRIGTVSDITTHEYTDKIEEEGKPTKYEKWNAYRFRDTGITFSEDYVLPGVELKLVFQSGVLNGMEFAVWFNPDKLPEKNADGTWNPEAQVFEVVRNEDYGRPLPDAVLFPQDEHLEGDVLVSSDTYILFGFDTKFVSDAMIPSAELELKEKAEKYIEKSKIDPSTYTCKIRFDSIMNANGTLRLFEAGDRVNLINGAYFETGNRQSRIIGFEYNLDIPYDSPLYTIGEKASYSRISDLEEKVAALTYKGQTYVSSGGNGVYVIGVNDKTLPSDRNTFSAKRILNEIIERAISKTEDDKAAGLITFLKGLTSKELIEANNGLVVRKTEVVEPMLMSLLSEEFEDGIVEENEDVFIEEMRTATGGAVTLGELDNVTDEADKISDTDDLLVRLAGASGWTINTTLFSQVSQLMSKVFPFTMTLSGGGTYEKGSSQTISLSWTYDRDIESQSINNESLLIGIRAKQYANVATDTTYTLKAIQGGQTYTKSVSAQFKVKKYYGVSASGTLTNDEILSLSNTWAGRTQGSTVFDCTGGKYPYYILPTSMVSGIQFWIGGLRNTDWKEETREVTNAFGHKESYTIYRLNSIQTGVLNIEVK
ncbi:hypothetical protein F3B42_14155 [Bacteroides ovatus]|nr:hypothetical protein F3B42_14155 [Bacteroides ovatus]KAA4680725.1 hypothetical protein F3B41_15445 [Bacteroides ovatus]